MSTPAASLRGARACQFSVGVGPGDALQLQGLRDDRLMPGLPVPSDQLALVWETLEAAGAIGNAWKSL